MEIIFDNPQYLFFLLSLPVLIIFHYVTLKNVRGRVLQFANFVAMSRITIPNVQPRNVLQLVLRLLTLTVIVLAVSGMRINYVGVGVGSDYVVTIDISSSMTSKDITPSRIDAAKEAAIKFVDDTPSKTKIGVVSFSGTSFIEQQMTENKDEIKNKIGLLSVSEIGGTDLGEAIITSANLLSSNEHAKTIILITDGDSNIGVGVASAIEYAQKNNIQIFTIGVGTVTGGNPEGINVTLKMDEDTLKRVAELTDGKYFHAESKGSVDLAYQSIIKTTKRKYTLSLTVILMFFTLAGFFVDWMLMNTKYKRIP